MRSRSLVTRMTATVTISAAALFLVVGLAIYILQTVELRRHQTSELRARLEIVKPLVERTMDAPDWANLREKLTSFTPRDDSVRYIIESPDARFSFGTPWPKDAQINRYSDGSYYVHLQDRTFHAVEDIVPRSAHRPASRLIVAADCKPLETVGLILGLGVLAVSLAAIAIVALLGNRLARRGLRPLHALSAHAAALDPNDPSTLLPEDRLPVELLKMTRAFNGALGRLHLANARLSTFNADVAHELRTPLANMIGQSQVALSRRRGAADLEDVLQSNLEELERMQSIVNDMLFLARADQGMMADNLVGRSIGQLARHTADIFEPMLEDAGMSLAISGDAFILVEPSLLSRALANLLDNAIRHGTRSGHIEVSIEDRDTTTDIVVRNPASADIMPHLGQLFDRFFRLDPARSRADAGHGLGLAISRAIALMHGGDLFARFAQGHVVMMLSLPMRVPQPNARHCSIRQDVVRKLKTAGL